MILLALQQLRRRGTRYASLLFAIFASVALTTASVALTSSLISNVNNVFGQPYENADWVVTVSGADQSEADQLRASLTTPETTAVAWDQRASVSIREDDGIYSDALLYSIEPGPLQWREIERGRLPEQPAEIAVNSSDQAPPVGSELQVRTSGAEDDVTAVVVGHVEAAAQDLLIGGTSVFASPATVAGWDSGSVRGEFRLSSPVAPTVDPAVATTVAASAHVEDLSDSYLGKRDRYFLVVTAFVLVAAVVAFLVIFSAYNVLTAERRRVFGLIRSVGASTSQIVGSVAVESVILGVLASGLGAPAGLAAARFLAGQAEGFGVRVPMESITMPDNVGWWIVAAGIAMPVLASLPAAISACRSTTVEALSPTAISRTRPAMSALWVLVAVMLLAGGWWLSRQVPRLSGQRGLFVSIAAAGAAVLGLALAAGILLPVVLQALSRALGRTALPSLQLGLAFPGQQKNRSAALIVVILAGAALSSAVLHGQSRVTDHLVASASKAGGTDVVIANLDDPVPAGLVDRLQAIPGVAEATAPPTAVVSFPDGQSTPVLMLDEATGASVMRSGDTGALPGTIVLGRASGLRDTFSAGSELTVTINDVPVQARVTHSDGTADLIDPALVHHAREVRAGELGVSPELLPEQPVRSIHVLLDGPPNQPDDGPVMAAVRQAVSEAPGRFSVSESFSARNATLDMTERITTMSLLLAVVALIIAAVGLINTVALTVAERAPVRRLLRAVGLTPTNQTVVLAGELAALSLPAALLGAMAGGLLGNYVAEVVTRGSATLGTATAPDPLLVTGIVGASVVGAVLCGLIVLAIPRRTNALRG